MGMPSIVGYRDGKKIFFAKVADHYQIYRDLDNDRIMLNIDDHHLNLSDIDSLYWYDYITTFQSLMKYKGELIYEKRKDF
jgi:hypothetical protein